VLAVCVGRGSAPTAISAFVFAWSVDAQPPSGDFVLGEDLNANAFSITAGGSRALR
jgi:hypothetical protein